MHGSRLFKACASRKIECVVHMIVECDRYEEERKTFMDLVNSETVEREFERLSDNEK